jgi:hypothetical protein
MLPLPQRQTAGSIFPQGIIPQERARRHCGSASAESRDLTGETGILYRMDARAVMVFDVNLRALEYLRISRLPTMFPMRRSHRTICRRPKRTRFP